MEETKIDVQDFDSFDIQSYSPAYEDGTIGVIEPDTVRDPPDDSTTPTKIKEETHKGSDPSKSWLPFLSIEYYQSYFDVTTSDVFHRVVAGISPFPYKLSSVIATSPDLYGPFWLCMTLIFTTAISGNLSALFSGNNQWEFHFHEVITIATVVYAYTWVLPVVLWVFLVWRNSTERYSLVKLQSIYGYSMGSFIPLTLMWVINVESLRWLVLAVSVALSGAVLVQALWRPLQNETKRIAIGIVCIVLVLHTGVATGFKLYYFSSSLAPKRAPPTSIISITTPFENTPSETLSVSTIPELVKVYSDQPSSIASTDEEVWNLRSHSDDVSDGTQSIPITDSYTRTTDQQRIVHANGRQSHNEEESTAKPTKVANDRVEQPVVNS